MKIFLGAVVDGDFLTDTAEELFKKNEVLKVPVMMGITNHEFGWILPQVGSDVVLFSRSWTRTGCVLLLLQSFAPPGWDQGMSRESVLAVVDMFNPAGVSATRAAAWQNEECLENEPVPLCSLAFQPSPANSLITDEYLRNATTPAEIRDRFTHVLGDILMTLPVLSVAGYLSGPEMSDFFSGLLTFRTEASGPRRKTPLTTNVLVLSSLCGASADAGVPVYLYEFVYRADVHRHSRPGFVKADHGDDVAFVFGSCFWDGHTRLAGRELTRDPGVSPALHRPLLRKLSQSDPPSLSCCHLHLHHLGPTQWGFQRPLKPCWGWASSLDQPARPPPHRGHLWLSPFLGPLPVSGIGSAADGLLPVPVLNP